MRRLTGSLITASLITVLLAGCATISQPLTTAQKLQRIGNIAELAAFDGAALWLASHPADRPRFEMAVAALESMSATNGFDPIAFSRALQTLPIKELRTKQGIIIIDTVILLYEFELQNLLAADRQVYVATVAGRVRSGIARALEVSALPPPPPNVSPNTNAPPKP